MLFEELPVKDFKMLPDKDFKMQLPSQKGPNLWRVEKCKNREMKLFWIA